MTDTLVERLRAGMVRRPVNAVSDAGVMDPNATAALMSEAADLIEHNASEIRELRRLIDLKDTLILDMQAEGKPTEAEAAYGLLWRMHTPVTAIHAGRRALIDMIGKDGQRRGIDWARATFGPHPIPAPEDMP